MEEYFDIVDKLDRVIGRSTRAQAHARGLWHRAIHVLVFDAAGRVFLQKRSMKKDVAPGRWDSSCSGHVDSGETYDAAALRELFEELGLESPAAPRRLFRLEPSPETGWEFVWVYRLAHEGPFTLNPEEIDRGEWLEPGELARRIDSQPDAFSRTFLHVWERVLPLI